MVFFGGKGVLPLVGGATATYLTTGGAPAACTAAPYCNAAAQTVGRL